MSAVVAVAYDWLKRHAGALALCAVGLFFGAKLFRRKNSAVVTLGGAARAQRARDTIKTLEGERAALTRSLDASADDDAALGRIIEDKKRALAAENAGKPWGEMTDDEVRASLRALGL